MARTGTTEEQKIRKDGARVYFDKRLGALRTERTSFMYHWRDLSQFIQPRRGRFLLTDVNKGVKRHQNIINSRATQAHRTCKAGLYNGIMSPTRPWFGMETADPDLMKRTPVRVWIAAVEQRILSIFAASNLYNMAPRMIAELVLFGTGAMAQVDDFYDVVRFYTYPTGSYFIAQNDRYEVDTFVREFQMTVNQMIAKFGLKNVSAHILRAYDLGNYESWYPVVHFIEPNPDFDRRSKLSARKRFRSVYYEPGYSTTSGAPTAYNSDPNKLLSRAGYDQFPMYVPRWDVTGEDVYGTNSPAMEALGDVRGLQVMERRKSQAVDKLVNPPLAGPPQLKNVPVSGLPGGLTTYTADPNGHKLSPIYQITPDISDLREDINEVERRINEAFYVNLFQAISSMEGIQPKNQLELSQRNQERLQQLGPVLEQLHGEWLNKMIDRTFTRLLSLWAQGVPVIPDIPGELSNQPLKVKYVSPLALAQRSVVANTLTQFTEFTGMVAQVDQSVLDKFNADEVLEQYALATGVPPGSVRDQKEAEQIRAQRQKIQEMQMQIEAAQGVANAAQQGANAERQHAEANK